MSEDDDNSYRTDETPSKTSEPFYTTIDGIKPSIDFILNAIESGVELIETIKYPRTYIALGYWSRIARLNRLRLPFFIHVY